MHLVLVCLSKDVTGALVLCWSPSLSSSLLVRSPCSPRPVNSLTSTLSTVRSSESTEVYSDTIESSALAMTCQRSLLPDNYRWVTNWLLRLLEFLECWWPNNRRHFYWIQLMYHLWFLWDAYLFSLVASDRFFLRLCVLFPAWYWPTLPPR